MTTLPSVDPKGHILVVEMQDEPRIRAFRIPRQGYPWCAFRDGNIDSGPHGRGWNKNEAIADLLEQERK